MGAGVMIVDNSVVVVVLASVLFNLLCVLLRVGLVVGVGFVCLKISSLIRLLSNETFLLSIDLRIGLTHNLGEDLIFGRAVVVGMVDRVDLRVVCSCILCSM